MRDFSSTILSYFLLLALIGGLSACGFQLRGSTSASSINASSIFIGSQGANRVAYLIRTQLEFQNISIPKQMQNAEYVLRVSNELRDRKVLTVSSTTGKVQEYELNYSVLMTVLDNKGNTLREQQAIHTSRDLYFDENAVLAIGTEENLIYEELEQQAANTILRRLQASIQ